MGKNKLGLVKEMIENTAAYDEALSEESADEAMLDENVTDFHEGLKTHQKIKNAYVGSLSALSKNNAKVVFQTTYEMAVDDLGLVHNGFIFGAAEYAAVAAINEANLVVIGCRSKFFAPARVGDIISFEAKGRFEEARKREVKVVGIINEIKVFEGIFQAVLLEHHILETKLDDLQANLAKEFA
ncbi:MAG: PaaI family thioesterase [Sulfurospirillum cavolei]|nr:PaaI family thioesterase [Sulfurospirillum cavolei]